MLDLIGIKVQGPFRDTYSIAVGCKDLQSFAEPHLKEAECFARGTAVALR
ncbi:MAG: hypothetical protein ABW003_08325 [Microvirga sp.]